MNRWKGSANRALVWGLLLLVGGMILYTGYLGTLFFNSQKSTPMITNEAGKGASASTALDPEAGRKALIMPNQTGEMSAEEQAIVTNSTKKGQEVPGELNLKDFPCPVHGVPLRSVGNYYSEAFNSYLFHAGMDYAEPEGTMIRATHGGKVIFSGVDPILGQKVTLDCGDGWLVTYGSLVNLRVQVGQSVET